MLDDLPPRTASRRSSKRVHAIRFGFSSIVVLTLFCINLVVMPFKPYLSEQASILPPSFRASPPFPKTLSVPFPPETWNFFLEYYAKQPREYNYVNDGVHNIEIVRTALRYNSTVRLTDLHGGPYFPIKLVDQVIACFQGGNATATTCSIRHAWKFHLMTLPTATCIAWIDQTQSRSGHDSDTLVFLLIPEAHGTFHRVSKMIMRIFLSLYIATCIVTQYLQPLLAMKRALRRYPIHPSSSAAVFVIFAGEPTSLILSNRFVCAVAVLDLVFSSEYLAQSCLRIACSDDSTLFVLGIMYLSHVVWFAYASLALMNQMLHRAKKSAWFRPVNATLLAILSYFLGGVCS
ncbi:unnamed protein product [Aphanomyces euteiches]